MSDGSEDKPTITPEELAETDAAYVDEDGKVRFETERLHKGGWKHPDER